MDVFTDITVCYLSYKFKYLPPSLLLMNDNMYSCIFKELFGF